MYIPHMPKQVVNVVRANAAMQHMAPQVGLSGAVKHHRLFLVWCPILNMRRYMQYTLCLTSGGGLVKHHINNANLMYTQRL